MLPTVPSAMRERTEAQKEEIWALITKAQSGDEAVMNEMITGNMGLVHSVAARFRDRGVEYEDLVQIGVMGMLRAIKSFDVTYRTAFSTYAVPLIIGEIRRYLRDDGMVKVSREIKRQGIMIQHEREVFRGEFDREPTPTELAERLEMSVEDCVFAMEACRPVHSLSEPIHIGQEQLLLESVLSDETLQIDRLTDRITLEQSVKKLSELEQKVLFLRYRRDLSQQQTANLLGLSQVKVSRMEKKIFAFLRQALLSS